MVVVTIGAEPDAVAPLEAAAADPPAAVEAVLTNPAVWVGEEPCTDTTPTNPTEAAPMSLTDTFTDSPC